MGWAIFLEEPSSKVVAADIVMVSARASPSSKASSQREMMIKHKVNVNVDIGPPPRRIARIVRARRRAKATRGGGVSYRTGETGITERRTRHTTACREAERSPVVSVGYVGKLEARLRINR